MKNFLYILFSFLGFYGYTQNSGEKDVQYLTSVEAFLISPANSLKISTYDDGKQYEKKLFLKVVANDCKEQQGLKILLSSGEAFFLNASDVNCIIENSMSYSVAEIDLANNRKVYDKLKEYEIVSYQIGENIIPVTFKEKGENLRLMLQFSEEK